MVESLRVLHVTETFSAGTGTAVVGFARALRDAGIESSLLAQDRGSGLLASLTDAPFAQAEIVPPGLRRLWSAVGRTVSRTRPHIVHVHSSKAGAIARSRIRLLARRPVVLYSPHCFGFERRDVSPAARAAMWWTEWMLARSTDGFVCVSPHEAELAGRLRPAAPTYTLVNRFQPSADLVGSEKIVAQHGIRLVTAGRAAAQKDPARFVQVLDAVRSAAPDAEVSASWIGSGKAIDEAVLRDAGVEVTGWLPAQDVQAAMVGGCYLHTAGWEAAVPLAVFDAMEAGLPVVVRRLAAYGDMIPVDWQFDTPAQAAAMIMDLRDPVARAARVAAQRDRLSALYRQGPETVLPEAYRDVVRAHR